MMGHLAIFLVGLGCWVALVRWATGPLEEERRPAKEHQDQRGLWWMLGYDWWCHHGGGPR